MLGGADDALKAQLRAGELDFVLAATPDAPQLEPDLDWRPLMADDYRVIAATHHPLHGRKEHGVARPSGLSVDPAERGDADGGAPARSSSAPMACRRRSR